MIEGKELFLYKMEKCREKMNHEAECGRSALIEGSKDTRDAILITGEAETPPLSQEPRKPIG